MLALVRTPSTPKYDSHELTANARAGFFAKFLREVDAAAPGHDQPERLRRAEHLMRSHMAKLALRVGEGSWSTQAKALGDAASEPIAQVLEDEAERSRESEDQGAEAPAIRDLNQ